MKNQEGQTPLDLSTADDVRSLLLDALPPTAIKSPSGLPGPTTTPTTPTPQTMNPGIRTAGMGVSAPPTSNFRPTSAPAVGSASIGGLPALTGGSSALTGGTGSKVTGASGTISGVKGISGAVGGITPIGQPVQVDGAIQFERLAVEGNNPMDISVCSFLSNLQLDHLRDIFEKEQVSFHVMFSCNAVNLIMPNILCNFPYHKIKKLKIKKIKIKSEKTNKYDC